MKDKKAPMRKKEKDRIRQEEKRRSIRKRMNSFVKYGLITLTIFLLCSFLLTRFILPAYHYQQAVELIQTGHYLEGCELFANLGNYKDSRVQLKTNAARCLSIARLESVVYWGEYEQDNRLSNGKEAIAWKVLARNDNRMLLLSEKVLDAKPYNQEKGHVTWEDSSLRNWLNHGFLSTAFTADEQAAIEEVEVINSINSTYCISGGNNTTDKIFLLSLDELKQYFHNPYYLQVEETPYATKQVPKGAFKPFGWWLRSPGIDLSSAAMVSYDREVWADGGLLFHLEGIRPAVWIDLKYEK